MVNKALGEEDWCSGHALMASAPPIDHVREHGMDKIYPHQLPDLPKPDLVKMLNLCSSLPGLNDEVTPIMAWALLLSHPRCVELTEKDFEAIKADLKHRVTCYGYEFAHLQPRHIFTNVRQIWCGDGGFRSEGCSGKGFNIEKIVASE